VWFDAQGIGRSSASGSIFHPWSEFDRVSQDARYFYLRMRDGVVFPIPRPEFTDEQAKAFLQYAKLPQKA
jgi:YcxB-like protein